MNPRLLLLGALLATSAVTGCPGGRADLPPIKPAVLPTVPPGDYFPLAEGMQWKYEVVTQGANAQGTLVLTVTKVTKEGADTAAEGVRTLQLRFSNGSTHGSEAKVTWRKTRSGVYETIDGEAEERQVLALPLKIGVDWTFGPIAMNLTAFADQTVNGKDYKNALRVRAEDGDRLGYATFAKDVGLVAWWGRKLPPTGDQQVGFGLLEHVKKGATPPPAPASAGATPSPAPSASPTASPSADPSASPGASPSPSASPSASPTSSPAPSVAPSQFIFS